MKLRMALKMPTMYDFIQALERGARAGIVAILALYPGSEMLDNLGGSPINVDDAKKALVAGLMALIAFLWRWLLPYVLRSTPEPDPALGEPTPVDHPAETDPK